MGLDLNAVGNHEFDEGVMELLRVYRNTGEPIFPPYAIRKFGNIKRVTRISRTSAPRATAA